MADAWQNPLTVVQMLWCGHGQLGLVEIYNDGVPKKEADFLALINCGGEKEYAQEALDYVASKVEARHRKLLNLVVFTSVDEDSTNLLDQLGERLASIKAEILECFVGGSAWQGPGPAAVRRFVEGLGFPLTRVEFASQCQSDYPVLGSGSDWIAEHNGTYFRILVTDDHPTVRATVLAVENGRFLAVLPGRLTLPLMKAAAELLEKVWIPQNRVLVLPNHGVLETAVAEHCDNPTEQSEAWMKVIRAFAAALGPTEVWVSAGVSRDKPVAQVLDQFSAKLLNGPEHTYVCYALPDAHNISGDWQTVTTEKTIHTTLKTYGAQQVTTFGDIRMESRLRAETTTAEEWATP